MNRNMSLREALKLAVELGVKTRELPQTGEIGVIKPAGGLLRISSQRKDAPRYLLTILRQAQKEKNRCQTSFAEQSPKPSNARTAGSVNASRGKSSARL